MGYIIYSGHFTAYANSFVKWKTQNMNNLQIYIISYTPVISLHRQVVLWNENPRIWIIFITRIWKPWNLGYSIYFGHFPAYASSSYLHCTSESCSNQCKNYRYQSMAINNCQLKSQQNWRGKKGPLNQSNCFSSLDNQFVVYWKLMQVFWGLLQ